MLCVVQLMIVFPLAGTESIRSFVERLFASSPLGNVVQKAVDTAGSSVELVKRYVHDFIRMVYKPTSCFANLEFEV